MVLNNSQANINKVNGALADIFANRPPAQSTYYIFYAIDTFQIWYDSATGWILLGSGGGGGGGAVNFFLTDYATLLNDVNSANLSPGSFYFIQDRYFGILTQAAENDRLRPDACVQLAVPKTYNNGFFFGNNWRSIYNPNNTYALNDVAIWGAKVWVNLSGNNGSIVDPITLNGDWAIQPDPNGAYYNFQYIDCLYDINTDWIYSGRFNGNQIGDIDKNSWINNYNFYGNNPVERCDWMMSDFYDNRALFIFNNAGTFGGNAQININVALRGIYGNISLAIVNNNSDSIENNRVLFLSFNQVSGINANTMAGGFGVIENNTGRFISNNNLANGSIQNNFVQNINGNVCIGNINFNTGFQINNNINNGLIERNNCSTITGNANNGEIRLNIGGTLLNNQNQGDIFNNYIGDTFSNNTNQGQIYNNKVTFLSNNSNTSVISHNIGETLSNNTNQGQIFGNQFLQLNSNSNVGMIQGNRVTGFLNVNSGTGDIIGNIAGSIVTNTGGAMQYNVVTDLITNNTDEVSKNFCKQIQGNTCLILGNFCGDKIDNNTCGAVVGNYVYAGIYNNSNTGEIAFNHCNIIIDNQGTDPDPSGKRISFNHVLGGISQNRNNGHILSNQTQTIIGNLTNCLRIEHNDIPGQILSNDNVGNIRWNTNAGDIRDNNNTGDIRQNQNNGDIRNQVAAVTDIRHNINNGDISGVNAGVVSDPIVNK